MGLTVEATLMQSSVGSRPRWPTGWGQGSTNGAFQLLSQERAALTCPSSPVPTLVICFFRRSLVVYELRPVHWSSVFVMSLCTRPETCSAYVCSAPLTRMQSPPLTRLWRLFPAGVLRAGTPHSSVKISLPLLNPTPWVWDPPAPQEESRPWVSSLTALWLLPSLTAPAPLPGGAHAHQDSVGDSGALSDLCSSLSSSPGSVLRLCKSTCHRVSGLIGRRQAGGMMRQIVSNEQFTHNLPRA